MVNKAQTRNTSRQNVTSPSLSTPPRSLPFSRSAPTSSCGRWLNCASSLSMRRPCYPVAHNVPPQRDDREAGSSSPGHVRREPITFHCCFSTLCKEQSALISGDYRRMLIHYIMQTDCRQRTGESQVFGVFFPQAERCLKQTSWIIFFFIASSICYPIPFNLGADMLPIRLPTVLPSKRMHALHREAGSNPC